MCGNLKGKGSFGRNGRRWDDTIKIILKEIRREGMDRNHLLRSGIAGCSGQGHDTFVFKRRGELLVNRADVALA